MEIYCEAAKNVFGLMWSLIIIFSTVGDIFLIIFEKYFGFVLTRLLYGGFQTAGFALIGLYETNPYYVVVGQIFLCFAANRSFSHNVQSGDLYLKRGTQKLSVIGTGNSVFNLN